MKKLRPFLLEFLDWLLILFPMIVTYPFLWFRRDVIFENGGDGMSADTIGLLGIFVPALITILGLFLKYTFADRKQYKDIISRLGEFKGIDLESRIGNTSKAGTLVHQHKEIKNAVTQAEQRLAASLKDTGVNVGTIASTIREEKLIREQREKLLGSQKIDTRAAYNVLDAMTKKISDLLEEQSQLRQRIRELELETKNLQRELRNRDIEPAPPQHDWGMEP